MFLEKLLIDGTNFRDLQVPSLFTTVMNKQEYKLHSIMGLLFNKSDASVGGFYF